MLMAIQTLCIKQTASDYQVGQFHPAPTNWKKKYLLCRKIMNLFVFTVSKAKKFKCASNGSYLHHFMIWSQISLNTCQILFLSLFRHFQSKFLSNSCINRTRWFNGGTINIDNFVPIFKLKRMKNRNYKYVKYLYLYLL